jgi:hypothetical protein
MPVGVSIPTIQVSLSSANAAIWTTTPYVISGGVSLNIFGVSLCSATLTVAPPATGTFVLNFSNSTGSMYVAILGGFA